MTVLFNEFKSAANTSKGVACPIIIAFWEFTYYGRGVRLVNSSFL